jgi:hypothetical protein
MIWVPNYLSPGQDSPNPGRGLTALCTPADFHHSSAGFDMKGRSYFVSKTLAGCSIRLVVLDGRLIVGATIPLHKEYRLY